GTFRGLDGRNYTNNAFNWPYMQSGGLQDIGVDEAWRALAETGKLSNRIRVMIVDSGFSTMTNRSGQSDLPSTPATFGQIDEAGPGTCGGNPCPWHGMAVFEAGFAALDNQFGVAGPGGPVADPVFIGTPTSTLWDIVEGLEGFLLASSP